MTNSCRICLESEGQLIAPCHCKGTIQYVHPTCLQTWRRTSANSKSFHMCELCNYHYSSNRSMIGTIIRTWYVKQILATIWLLISSWFVGAFYHFMSPNKFPITSITQMGVINEHIACGLRILGVVGSIPILIVIGFVVLEGFLANHRTIQDIILLTPTTCSICIVTVIAVGNIQNMYLFYNTVSDLIDDYVAYQDSMIN